MTNEIDISDFKPYSNSLGELYKDTLKELLIPYPSIELPGWPLLNELTGGFRAREFTIFCGATGAGKTTLLTSWAKAFLLAKKRCFIMSVETGHTDFIKRTMSAFAGVDMNRGMALNKEALQAFHGKYGELFSSDGLYLSLYDNRINHEAVLKEMLWHKEKKGCDVVFIDNLNFLLDVVADNKQVEVMDKVVHDLIMFAKRVDIHIIMVMHPKKTDNGRVESEFDIKGSSTACQEAHNIFIMNRATKADIESGAKGMYAREVMIKKLRRRGESVGKSLWLKYLGGSYTEHCIEDTKYERLR